MFNIIKGITKKTTEIITRESRVITKTLNYKIRKAAGLEVKTPEIKEVVQTQPDSMFFTVDGKILEKPLLEHLHLCDQSESKGVLTKNPQPQKFTSIPISKGLVKEPYSNRTQYIVNRETDLLFDPKNLKTVQAGTAYIDKNFGSVQRILIKMQPESKELKRVEEVEYASNFYSNSAPDALKAQSTVNGFPLDQQLKHGVLGRKDNVIVPVNDKK